LQCELNRPKFLQTTKPLYGSESHERALQLNTHICVIIIHLRLEL